MKSLPILASECFFSYFTPGPKICQGPAGHVQSSGWPPVRGRRKGNKQKPVRSKAYKTVFEILLLGRNRNRQETSVAGDRVAASSLISVRNDLEQSWFGIHAKTMINNLVFVRHLRCKTKVCKIIEVGAKQSVGLFPSSASPSVAGLPHTEGHGLRR